MNKEPIISVEEFRKFAGKDADALSDTQVKELIDQLDFIAQLFIKNQRANKED